MSTDPGTIDFLLDQLGTRGAVYSTKRMFGEYCLYRNGLPVGLVCDDALYVKDTDVGRCLAADWGEPEFSPPYPGARLHLRFGPDRWDDGDRLRSLLDATAAAMPALKPRRKASKRDAGIAVENAGPAATPVEPGGSTPSAKTRTRRKPTAGR